MTLERRYHSRALAAPMTASEYRAVLEALELTQAAAGLILGITVRQSQRYAAGSQIPKLVAVVLRLLLRGKLKLADLE